MGIRILSLLILVFSGVAEVSGQAYDQIKGGGVPDPQLSQKDNDYLDRQAKVFLDTIQSILSKYPPHFCEISERGMAKLLMDAVFHEKYAAYRKPVQVFFQSRAENVIKELEETKVKEGIVIWKIYNWIDKVAKNHHVDMLMPDAWAMDILRIARGFDPELVVPGHELELGHIVWDRLPYWGDNKYLELNYDELKRSEYPVVVMIWGESYRYYPKTDKKY